MRRLAFLLFILAGCAGGSGTITTPDTTAAKRARALDPWITIRTRDLLDTTTAPGRAHWHIYALLTGPQINQNGISTGGSISLADVRLGHGFECMTAGADSIGQRLISMLAVADTTNAGGTPDATAQAIANAWYAGNRALPSGWMALYNAPADAWASAQFTAGHGRVANDPIKWGLDWTGNGTVTFYERTDTDTFCNIAG